MRRGEKENANSIIDNAFKLFGAPGCNQGLKEVSVEIISIYLLNNEPAHAMCDEHSRCLKLEKVQLE